jgi:hypothetical protein
VADYALFMTGLFSLSKNSYRNRTFNRKTLLVQFYALNFMQRFRLKITFSAVRASYDRDIFYNKDLFALTVSPGNSADTRA